jgi:K+-transporting ATPase ATPase C chain
MGRRATWAVAISAGFLLGLGGLALAGSPRDREADLGAAFDDSGPAYFHGGPPPTATEPDQRTAALLAENPNAVGPVPPELLVSPGDGPDGRVSPACIEWQMPRVASERRVLPATLRKLVKDFTEAPLFGWLGGARVNLHKLNIALDEEYPLH